VNYIHYAVKECGKFDGPFAELFRSFWNRYMGLTGDDKLVEVVQPFFAFRVLVITNPDFYPEESNQNRRKLLNFGHSVLAEETFDIDRINDYFEGR
jgi:hypothetical protein